MCAQFGLAGWALAPDFTHGVNGWHVHAHGVLLTSRVLSAEESAALDVAWFALWRAACEHVGAGTPLRRFNGLTPLGCDEAAVKYLIKAMQEVTRSDTKHGHGHADRSKGRSPWELIRSFFETGDTADLALWLEYEAATKGMTCVSFSKSARALMAAYGVREAREDELASAQLDAETVDTLTLCEADMAVLRAVPGRTGVLLLLMRDVGAVGALGALVHWGLEDERRRNRPARRALAHALE
jgi:hypothetical protein